MYPDLLPSDITGTTWNPKVANLNISLVQYLPTFCLRMKLTAHPAPSLLLEVMEEQQVTVDGVSVRFQPIFFV